jgi:hypothetical protein
VWKYEAPGALAPAHDLRHNGLEIMPVRTESVQPDYGRVGLWRRFDFDGF